MINIQVQGKTTNEVITHLQAMLKDLQGNNPIKIGAPENKMVKQAKATKAVEEDEDFDDEEEVIAKPAKKKAAPVVEEDEEDYEDEDESEDAGDEDEVSFAEVRTAVLNLGKTKGAAVAKNVLAEFNYKSVVELDSKKAVRHYAPILAKCKKLSKK